jgi:AbrB family looped-hinge helix DNA binding protein
MRITSKGQVTIPKEMRDEFALLPGTEVEFVAGDGGELIVRKAKSGRRRGREFIEHLHEAGKNITMSTDEIMKLTRGEDWGTGHLEEGDRDSR